MPIHLVCECGARVIAPTKRAGQSIRCPKCDGRINVPLGESQVGSSFSPPARTNRFESAIADLVTARQADLPPTPQRRERIDPPQEKLRPKAPLAAPLPTPKHPIPAKPAPVQPTLVQPTPIPPAQQPLSQTALLESIPQRDALVLQTLHPEKPKLRIDAPLEIESTSPRKSVTQEIRIVTTSKRAAADKGWLGAVYGLALLWTVLALVGMAIALAESYFYFQTEELWRLERWALLVLASSAVQIGLAVYLVQAADWIACRAAAAVISSIAAAEALVLAVTMFSQRDGWFARFLDLTPHIANQRAMGFALLLTLLSVLLAYTTASVSMAWQREERKLLAKKAAV